MVPIILNSLLCPESKKSMLRVHACPETRVWGNASGHFLPGAQALTESHQVSVVFWVSGSPSAHGCTTSTFLPTLPLSSIPPAPPWPTERPSPSRPMSPRLCLGPPVLRVFVSSAPPAPGSSLHQFCQAFVLTALLVVSPCLCLASSTPWLLHPASPPSSLSLPAPPWSSSPGVLALLPSPLVIVTLSPPIWCSFGLDSWRFLWGEGSNVKVLCFLFLDYYFVISFF